MLRLLLSAFLAAVLMFVCGFVFWAILATRFQVMQSVAEDEAAIHELASHLPKSGVYRYPNYDEGNMDQKEFARKHTKGPLVTIFYQTAGADPMQPRVLVMGFVHYFIVALLAGNLLYMVKLPTYFGRWGFILALGVFAAVFIDPSDTIWFSHPWQYPLFNAAYHVATCAVAGVVLAAFIRPAAKAA